MQITTRASNYTTIFLGSVGCVPGVVCGHPWPSGRFGCEHWEHHEEV